MKAGILTITKAVTRRRTSAPVGRVTSIPSRRIIKQTSPHTPHLPPVLFAILAPRVGAPAGRAPDLQHSHFFNCPSRDGGRFFRQLPGILAPFFFFLFLFAAPSRPSMGERWGGGDERGRK
jgi:hypothetical protein